jgi:putative membrane protein (TIGR04086 family)
MRWGRIVAGGFLAEVLLMGAVLPGFFLGSEPAVIWTAVIGSPIVTFLAALWAARRLESRLALQGALVGLAAMLIFLVPMLLAGADQPTVYWLAHGLKVLGGLCGGTFAARRVAGGAAVAASA